MTLLLANSTRWALVEEHVAVNSGRAHFTFFVLEKELEAAHAHVSDYRSNAYI